MGYQIHIDISWLEGSQPQSQELRRKHMRLLLPWTTLLCCNGLKYKEKVYSIINWSPLLYIDLVI